jgi:hypothetical protein
MKGWITLIVIVALLILVGYLQSLGYFRFDWKPLTILFAALAAPFKMLSKYFGAGDNSIENIALKHEKERQLETEYQNRINAEIEKRKTKIDFLKKDIEVLDARIETLETRKAAIGVEVKNMNAEQKQKRFNELFGQ